MLCSISALVNIQQPSLSFSQFVVISGENDHILYWTSTEPTDEHEPGSRQCDRLSQSLLTRCHWALSSWVNARRTPRPASAQFWARLRPSATLPHEYYSRIVHSLQSTPTPPLALKLLRVIGSSSLSGLGGTMSVSQSCTPIRRVNTTVKLSVWKGVCVNGSSSASGLIVPKAVLEVCAAIRIDHIHYWVKCILVSLVAWFSHPQQPVKGCTCWLWFALQPANSTPLCAQPGLRMWTILALVPVVAS